MVIIGLTTVTTADLLYTSILYFSFFCLPHATKVLFLVLSVILFVCLPIVKYRDFLP